jgi:tetratricopeptide (TPR) repeat protein
MLVTWARHGGFPAFLFIATILAYLNALDAGFQFDDFNVIVFNDAVHSWSAWWASMPGIRPLLKLSYCANWVFDDQAWGFHLVNLLAHVVNTALVYLLARYWARRLARADDTQAGLIALATASIFALHPANTEAVTYVSGRSVSFMASFYLGALVLCARADASNRARIGAMLAFAGALAVKEIAVTLPFALTLMFGLGDRHRLSEIRPFWLILITALVLMLALTDYRAFFGHSLDTRGVLANLIAQIEGLRYLVAGPLLSLRLNIDPDLVASTRLGPTEVEVLLALLATLAVAIWQWRRRPWLSFGLLWFFLMLAPTNSFLARYDIANDRQLYLALLGPAFIVAIVLVRSARPVYWAMLLGLGLALGLATHDRNRDYRDEISLWTATTRASPGKARPWNNLGYAHQIAGQIGSARAAYERALAIDPSYTKARANLRPLIESGK